MQGPDVVVVGIGSMQDVSNILKEGQVYCHHRNCERQDGDNIASARQTRQSLINAVASALITKLQGGRPTSAQFKCAHSVAVDKARIARHGRCGGLCNFAKTLNLHGWFLLHRSMSESRWTLERVAFEMNAMVRADGTWSEGGHPGRGSMPPLVAT